MSEMREKGSVAEHSPTQQPDDAARQTVRAAGTRRLISDSDVTDLTPVDISGGVYRYVKRIIDVTLSLAAAAVLFIPGIFIRAAIYIDDPGKVFFRQYRIGQKGKRFKIYKFRTMKTDTPEYMSTMDVDDPDKYITRLGKILRKTSVDELPQIYNILIGDMSIIGPRPLIPDEYEIHEMRNRFGVYRLKPGLTGIAQINGRDTVSPAEKVHWDVKYLENFGFVTDMKIFLATIPGVLLKKGVVEGHSKEDIPDKEEV